VVREPEWLTWPWQRVVDEARVPTRVVPDVDTIYREMAQDMGNELRRNVVAGKATRWILPVGPIGQYPYLVDTINEERLDLKDLFTFQMDEYLDWTCRPISPFHPLSFTGHLLREFFNKIDAELRPPPQQHHVPDARNLDKIRGVVEALGGIDTCYGGIGIHGHLAFNEAPNTRYGDVSCEEWQEAPTRIVALQPETLVVNGIQSAGGNFEAVPPYAVTIGMKDILCANRLRFCCNRGQWQRTIFRRTVLQEPTVRYPSTFIQQHPDAEVVADEDTAQPPTSHVV
jgi:glucosamine-6-phosphate deaminase